MIPKDNGINEHDTIETIYTVGPGLRMAIIFVCFSLTAGGSFFGGYEFCKRSIIAGDKSNQVEILKGDTKAGLELVKEFIEKRDENSKYWEGRDYDKECGDKLISDIVK